MSLPFRFGAEIVHFYMYLCLKIIEAILMSRLNNQLLFRKSKLRGRVNR